MTNEATIGNANQKTKHTEISVASGGFRPQDETTVIQQDDHTPSFENFDRVPPMVQYKRGARLQKLRHPEPVFKIASINSMEISAVKDDSLIQIND